MTAPHRSEPVDLAAESVAGEEDPGASIDMAMDSGNAEQAPTARPPMSPGDEAPAGTPGTGENVCPRCGGSGKVGGTTCPECQGTGKVTVGVGGA